MTRPASRRGSDVTETSNEHNASKVAGTGREALFLLLYLMICLLFLWPAPLHLGHAIIGGDFMYPTLWTFDVATQGILESGAPPFETRLLNFPEGGSLTFVGWSFILVATVFRGLGSSALLGTNIALVLHLVFGCYFAYRLALRITGKHPESMVGALAFGLSPYVLSLVWNGQIEKLSHAFLPAIVLGLVRFAVDRRNGALPLVGLAFGCLFATSPYNAIFAAYLAIATTVCLLLWGGPGTRLATLGRAGVTAGACFVCCIPYLAYRRWTSGADLEPLFRPVPFPQLPDTPWPSEVMNKGTLLGWFVPGKSPWTLGEALQFPVLHVHYLGWACIALSAAGLLWHIRGARPRRTATSVAVLCTATFAYLVAHGYCLVVHSSPAASGVSTVSLPLHWIYQWFPGIAAFAVPYRAVIVVSLCLSVLTAMGLAHLGRRLTTRRRLVLCALAGAAILLETRFLSPVPFPLPLRPAAAPPVYAHIASADGCGAVLDVPNEAHGLGAGANLPFIYYQSVHGHPTLLHLHYGPLHEPRMTPFQRGLAHACGRPVGGDLRPAEDTTLLDFGFLVLHENRLSGPTLTAVRAYLDDHLHLAHVDPATGTRLYTSPRTAEDAVGTSRYRLNVDLPDGCGAVRDPSPAGSDDL